MGGMFRSRLPRLRAELARVRAAIDAHPYNAPRLRRAKELIEARRGQCSPEELDAELFARGLPGLAECGRITAAGLVSFARLHRRRARLERRIARAEGR